MKLTTNIRTTVFACLTAITFFTVTPPAGAQAPSVNLKPHLYLAGGVATVSNPTLFKDILNNSFSVMAAVGLPLNTGFEIIPKLHYHKFSIADDFLLASSVTATNLKMTILTLGADVKMSLVPGPVPAKPYFLLGGGSATISQDAVGIANPGIDATKFYMNVGAGIDIKAGPTFAFFVEGKYTFVSNSGANLGIFPLMAGIRVM